MEGKKIFIGYDLGDGETITDLTALDHEQKTTLKSMTMPGLNTPGKAIPSAYGYNEDGEIVFASTILVDSDSIQNICSNFKRRPSDLLGKIDSMRSVQLLTLFRKRQWPEKADCPEAYTDKMEEFRRSVQTFTNAIFEDEIYQERLRSEAVDCEEIVFCVGHPTRWRDLDIEIYAAILNGSVLGQPVYAGKPCKLIMAAESRAAFLYVKDKTQSDVLPKGTCALLIDVGSSTIDLTAMTADSRNHQYNSGNNYLGARSIDFMIRSWYLNQLSGEDKALYRRLIEVNPTQENALTLQCRMAKEQIYSSSKNGKAKISFADFKPALITGDIIDNLINSVPVSTVLKDTIGLPDFQAKKMGTKSWAELFGEFLKERKSEMGAQKLKLGRVIMTGSASKMPVVSKTVKNVFREIPEGQCIGDMDPSRTISQGLALVGPSNEKSRSFQADVKDLIQNDVPKIIEQDIPKLADAVSGVLDSIVSDIIRTRMVEWRSSKFKTLDDMMNAIKKDCSENNLSKRLSKDADYNKAMEDWTVNVVGKDIALKLQAVCKKYNVSIFTLDSLNVMRTISIDPTTGMPKINPTEDMMGAIGGLIAVIGGIVMFVITPLVAAVVVVLLSYISINLAALLFALLAGLPGPGWAVLASIAAVGVGVLIRNGVDSVKKVVTERIQGWDLPEFARQLLTNKKINKQIAKVNIKEQIHKAILEKKSKDQIVASVSESLAIQVEKRAEDIKYFIESK